MTWRVIVLGGGVGGLATALLCARDGHEVTLVERDSVHIGAALESPTWERRGIPHFRQPHAFIPRGRAELRRTLPDVYDRLIAAGASDVDLRAKLPGPTVSEDEELQYLAVRRPLIEWALRSALHRQAGLRVLDRARVTGLEVVGRQVRGAVVNGKVVEADVVVDALGRRTPSGDWLTAAGHAQPTTETSDCGVVYYCRYFAPRDDFQPPDGPWLLSPRGDLGYFAFSTFPGDNRTFASVLAVPPGRPAWRKLKDPTAYQAAVARIPMLSSWVDLEGVDPITDVLPMAGLRNSIRRLTDPPAGFFVVGDAACHTDPVLAHGLAFALVHAAEVATALREHSDLAEAGRAHAAVIGPELQERYDFATELDEQRLRMWTGGPVDLAHAAGDFALFSMAAAGAVALRDPDVFRAFVRRIGLLDSTQVFDRDKALHERVERAFEQMMASGRPRLGPSETEMEEVVVRAVL